MSKKEEVIEQLFALCQSRGDYVFDNNDVKSITQKIGFSNPFDATKIDQSKKLPDSLRAADYFIMHLGDGRHQFVQGIQYGYHAFEPPQQHINYPYRKSLLNEVDTSESNILSLCVNQGIFNDFLYKDVSAPPKTYGSRRTKCDLAYRAGQTPLMLNKVQMEIDLTMECDGIVTIFEAKNGFHDDFAVYQLFHPFLYYHQLKESAHIAIQQVNCCYLLRQQKKLRLYLYTFSDLTQIASIERIKAHQYELVEG